MINYYEILEVSEKASNEVIEKAYRVLAKKYHPDLQKNENKKLAEEKMKLINEAYDILSNQEKKEAYNKKLYAQREIENRQKQEQTNINNNYVRQNYKQEQVNINNNYAKQNYNKGNVNNNNYRQTNYSQEEIRRQQEFKEKLEREARKRYLEAYDNYLRSLGYKVKYRWTWERIKALLVTILIIIFIGAVLWVIPPSREYMIKLYEENFVIKMIVDIIISLINAVISIFKID